MLSGGVAEAETPPLSWGIATAKGLTLVSCFTLLRSALAEVVRLRPMGSAHDCVS